MDYDREVVRQAGLNAGFSLVGGTKYISLGREQEICGQNLPDKKEESNFPGVPRRNIYYVQTMYTIMYKIRAKTSSK